MRKALDVLSVSCRHENRKTMFLVFHDLPVNPYCVSTVQQAKESLSGHVPEVVLCEERLDDGSYREVLVELRSKSLSARFVLMLCTGEWAEYLEALPSGVTEVLRAPLQAIDVDLAMIHALRDSVKNAELLPGLNQALSIGA
jgi:DNA-binding NtrC family response regulator